MHPGQLHRVPEAARASCCAWGAHPRASAAGRAHAPADGGEHRGVWVHPGGAALPPARGYEGLRGGGERFWAHCCAGVRPRARGLCEGAHGDIWAERVPADCAWRVPSSRPARACCDDRRCREAEACVRAEPRRPVQADHLVTPRGAQGFYRAVRPLRS